MVQCQKSASASLRLCPREVASTFFFSRLSPYWPMPQSPKNLSSTSPRRLSKIFVLPSRETFVRLVHQLCRRSSFSSSFQAENSCCKSAKLCFLHFKDSVKSYDLLKNGEFLGKRLILTKYQRRQSASRHSNDPCTKKKKVQSKLSFFFFFFFRARYRHTRIARPQGVCSCRGRLEKRGRKGKRIRKG